ncbi:hypothetical protein [Brevibacillus parabrevis]|jgi:hypothetical protein|uniref:hypothetical protein n=1 Tax=Brevibacillus parabrevis TaxID=54914 RepID=UPI0024937A2A|nr:hypothetical protein [Brevibacillus parabrevis]
MKKLGLLLLLLLAFIAGCAENPNTNTQNSSTLPDKIPVVAKNYKSEYTFEVLFYVPESRYYYVQQKEGNVTKESADAIVKELYSKEAWAENGGQLGNVLIYDSSQKLKKGERPDSNIVESAEYASRSSELYVNGEPTPFEPSVEK